MKIGLAFEVVNNELFEQPTAKPFAGRRGDGRAAIFFPMQMEHSCLHSPLHACQPKPGAFDLQRPEINFGPARPVRVRLPVYPMRPRPARNPLLSREC